MRSLARVALLVGAIAALSACVQTRGGMTDPGFGGPGGQPHAAAVYQGQYVCAQGLTSLELSVLPSPPGASQKAVFRFGPHPQNRGVPPGEFTMVGRVDPVGNGVVALRQEQWLRHPPGYLMVDLDGRVSPDGGTLRGRVLGAPGCTQFELKRVR